MDLIVFRKYLLIKYSNITSHPVFTAVTVLNKDVLLSISASVLTKRDLLQDPSAA